MSTYDIFTRISNNQTLTVLPLGIAATSTSSINLVSNGISTRIGGRDVGPGETVVFRLHITQTFDAGAGDLNVSVVFAADDIMTPGTSAFVPTLTIPNAGLLAGREYDIPFPTMPKEFFASGTGSAFVGLLYTPQALPSSGAVSAWVPLGHTPGLPKRYQGNYVGP